MAFSRPSTKTGRQFAYSKPIPPQVWLVSTVLLVTAFLVMSVLVFVGEQVRDWPPGTRVFPPLSRSHSEGNISYPVSPPVGGDHAPDLAGCRFYDTPVAISSAVHSLEHGAVWLTYRPDVRQDVETWVGDLMRMHPKLLISPLPSQRDSLVLTAWRAQLRFDALPKGVAANRTVTDFLSASTTRSFAPESQNRC